MGPSALEPPAGLGGSEMLSRGGGVKNGLQGGRIATYPPHAHLCDHMSFFPCYRGVLGIIFRMNVDVRQLKRLRDGSKRRKGGDSKTPRHSNESSWPSKRRSNNSNRQEAIRILG